MSEFNTEKVKEKKEFNRVVLELEAKGLSEEDMIEILVRDFCRVTTLPETETDAAVGAT